MNVLLETGAVLSVVAVEVLVYFAFDLAPVFPMPLSETHDVALYIAFGIGFYSILRVGLFVLDKLFSWIYAKGFLVHSLSALAVLCGSFVVFFEQVRVLLLQLSTNTLGGNVTDAIIAKGPDFFSDILVVGRIFLFILILQMVLMVITSPFVLLKRILF